MRGLTPDQLGRLYREHAPALRLYARQWGEGAEDLIQEAFVKLAEQAPAPERIVPWLYRVVRNQALFLSRCNARRRQREVRASPGEAWFSSVDDQLDARQAAEQLAQLPLEQREVIVARLWGGLTFEELAPLVGCSVATVHRRYVAGLLALKERLEGRCPHTPTLPTT